uniref:Chloride channel protein n=1 Tax=Meloidogyne floridensis TaxID=298350 RepID=A0A915P1V5_9BILA
MRRPTSIDRTPLLWRTPARTLSHSSLDPNEDPAAGLERVSSSSNLYDRRKRQERLREQEGRLRRNRRRSVIGHEHTLSEKYESLDYEIVENELYRAAEMDKDHQKKLFRRSVNRWVVCFLIGVFTALVAACIDVLVYYNSKLKFHIVINGLVQICEHGRIGDSGCTWIILFTWALYNCALVSIAASLVLFVSPVAIGSGIPQIKCFLNGVQIPGVVRLRTLIAKVIGVSCSVGGGLAAGKEGPMIHSGAVVAAGISQGRCISIPFDSGLFKYFRNDHEKRDFVSAGAAAGVSAAFASPIGGVLFSLEEGASFWNQALTWRMVWFFFSTIYYQNNYIRTKRQRFLECMLVATASAFIGFITLLLIDDCQSIGINPQLTGVMKLWCPKGKYSAIATLFFQNPEESVKSLFHSPLNSFKPLTLFVFAFEYYILTMWTYGLSVPSGIFIPSLLTGAAWGRLFGVGVQYFFPELEAIDSGKYALAGAAAQLGGIVRMTISLTAIIVEATKDITFGLPIMLVLMIAKWGIYDEHIDLAEVPILGWEPPKLSRNILVKNVMRRDVIALERIESVGRIVEILRSTRHHGFPVLDRIDAALDDSKYPNYGHLLGLVLRSHLIVLLKRKHFTHDYEGRNPVSNSKPVTLSDFSEFYPRIESRISELGLTSADERCWIDLKSFMHPSPHRVPLSASLDSIHQIFRGLGLRFLIAVDNENRLRGIITRKDIARFKERRVKNTFLVNELYISPYNN